MRLQSIVVRKKQREYELSAIVPSSIGGSSLKEEDLDLRS
jgi:hypothetical protein